MALVVQAAMVYRDTMFLEAHDAIPIDLLPSIAHEFTSLFPLEGDIVTCAQPGCLIIAKPTPWSGILGDMTSFHPVLVQNAAMHARSTNAPKGIVDFLEVCASNRLSLNKYLVRKSGDTKIGEDVKCVSKSIDAYVTNANAKTSMSHAASSPQ